ncbi:hypothetical protein SPSE_0297 [Staphylococcus pseudintermedius ED99]|nr:hypothetical protein SPSE_0297 [Staphylococcus pseudintermedius ED99]
MSKRLIQNLIFYFITLNALRHEFEEECGVNFDVQYEV